MTTIDQQARAEDLRWLAETGESLSGAARRLGLSTDGIEKWCQLHGLRDVLAALRSREPADPFRSERARAGAMARWDRA